MTSGRLLDIKAIDSLFYDYHGEVESIIMDMVADRIDEELLDIVFADLDEWCRSDHDQER